MDLSLRKNMQALSTLSKRLVAKAVGGYRARLESPHSQKGFSLTELLVVMAIMAVLASLIAPRLLNQVDKSKFGAARAQARSIKTSMDALRLDIGRYPTQEEGLAMLVKPPTGNASGVAGLWLGPYLDGEVPVDPWGNPYIYQSPAEREDGVPKIVSYGADGKEGGDGLDGDISV